MALNDKQRIFCIEYIRDLNGTKAAERAGYSVSNAADTAHSLLELPEIQERIQQLMDRRAKRAEITADDVLASIVEIRDRCLQAEPVRDRKGNQVYTETADGKLVPAYEFDSKGALRANELLGKHMKLFGTDGNGINLSVTEMGRVVVEEQTGEGEVKTTTLTFDVGAPPDHASKL